MAGRQSLTTESKDFKNTWMCAYSTLLAAARSSAYSVSWFERSMMSPISLPLALSSLKRLGIVRTCLGGSSSDQLLTISELMGVFMGMNLHSKELVVPSPRNAAGLFLATQQPTVHTAIVGQKSEIAALVSYLVGSTGSP